MWGQCRCISSATGQVKPHYWLRGYESHQEWLCCVERQLLYLQVVQPKGKRSPEWNFWCWDDNSIIKGLYFGLALDWSRTWMFISNWSRLGACLEYIFQTCFCMKRNTTCAHPFLWSHFYFCSGNKSMGSGELQGRFVSERMLMLPTRNAIVDTPTV